MDSSKRLMNSVLWDVEVALIIFSNRGKLFEFCSNSSMPKTREKYQRCTHGALQTSQSDQETQSTYEEYLKLKAIAEVLQQSEGHFLGEDLGQLSSNNLEQLEHQLDTSLNQIRPIKTRSMLDQLSHLQQKEERLLEVNSVLRKKEKAIEEQNDIIVKKTKEKENTIAQLAQWEQPNHGHTSSSFFLTEPRRYLGIGGIYQGEEPEMRNELELTLQPK